MSLAEKHVYLGICCICRDSVSAPRSKLDDFLGPEGSGTIFCRRHNTAWWKQAFGSYLMRFENRGPIIDKLNELLDDAKEKTLPGFHEDDHSEYTKLLSKLIKFFEDADFRLCHRPTNWSYFATRMLIPPSRAWRIIHIQGMLDQLKAFECLSIIYGEEANPHDSCKEHPTPEHHYGFSDVVFNFTF